MPTEAQVAKLSLQLTRACLQAEEMKQHLTRAHMRAKVETSKLHLDLGLAIRRIEKSKARAEEARDTVATIEDKATESVAKGEERIEVLCCELRDICSQLGETIEEGRQLRERLSANSDELMVAHLAIEEAKGVWEEEMNQASKWEKRVVTSYNESKGFQCSL